MPVYNSKSAMAKSLKGLHLFHFVLSNCSQRVRLALAEKGLPWASHHLDLTKNEHVTAEYQAINPKGVVPTLVNDGEVVVESNDILLYLEQRFPEPSLIPENNEEYAVMQANIDIASEAQGAIKVLSFDLIFRQFKLIKSEDEELSFLEKHRNNQEVVQFMEDFAQDGDAWEKRVSAAGEEMVGVLSRLDKALTDKPWLSGDEYGLADISWVVNIHRLNKASYPTDQYPYLCKWFEKAYSRQAFLDAVVNYQPDSESEK